MPRASKDGTRAQAPIKQKLNDTLIKRIRPQHKVFLVWDTFQRGLAVQVQPTGQKSFKCIYRLHGKPRWYHIGDVTKFSVDGVEKARAFASDIMYDVAKGIDPLAERIAERSRGTFKDLAARYVKEYDDPKTARNFSSACRTQGQLAARLRLAPVTRMSSKAAARAQAARRPSYYETMDDD